MMCSSNKKNGGKLYVAISRRFFIVVLFYNFFTYPTGISTVA